MINISAKEVKVIKRVKVACPKDGVHVAGKDGAIKGVHSLWFDKLLVPKGQTAFYLDGLRVSYSFGWFKPIKDRIVRKDFDTMRNCYKLDVSPKPRGIVPVKLNLWYPHEKKKIKCGALAIMVEHVHYPKEAWKRYAEGYPYDWDADPSPRHTPEGFKTFVAWAKKLTGKLVRTSWKLGDVVWCTNKQRWYLVDCGK